jgi:ADP-ribose pyrophosphatase
MGNDQDSKVLFSGKKVQVIQKGNWEFASRAAKVKGVVAIIGITQQGAILFCEQHRIPVGKRVIDIPAGLVGDENENENLQEGAAREFLEETGYEASKWTQILPMPTSPGMSSEVVTLFLAGDLRQRSKTPANPEEGITIHQVPLDVVDTWVADQMKRGDVLLDPKVFAALYFLRNRPDLR